MAGLLGHGQMETVLATLLNALHEGLGRKEEEHAPEQDYAFMSRVLRTILTTDSMVWIALE